jgi:hypothetical protein
MTQDPFAAPTESGPPAVWPQQPPANGAPPAWGQQYPSHGYPVGPPRAGTNGLAIASLVLGILWLYWLGSILALIFGHIALHQTKQNPYQGGRGLAIAGVVLGYVGVGIGALFLLLVVIFSAGSST